MPELRDEFCSLAEAAEYAKVCRQAIYLAIKKKQLRGEKRWVRNTRGRMAIQWVVCKADLDDYRAQKYNREKRVVDGKKLYDIDDDRWSVLHASKVLSSMLGFPFPVARVYYLLRIGLLRGKKHGSAWVIAKQDLVDLYEQERGERAPSFVEL